MTPLALSYATSLHAHVPTAIRTSHMSSSGYLERPDLAVLARLPSPLDLGRDGDDLARGLVADVVLDTGLAELRLTGLFGAPTALRLSAFSNNRLVA